MVSQIVHVFDFSVVKMYGAPENLRRPIRTFSVTFPNGSPTARSKVLMCTEKRVSCLTHSIASAQRRRWPGHSYQRASQRLHARTGATVAAGCERKCRFRQVSAQREIESRSRFVRTFRHGHGLQQNSQYAVTPGIRPYARCQAGLSYPERSVSERANRSSSASYLSCCRHCATAFSQTASSPQA